MARTTRHFFLAFTTLSLIVLVTAFADSSVGAAPRQLAAGSSDAAESRAYLHSYNLPSSGLALEGYCPVAYFRANKPLMGKPEHASTYNGVTYHFFNADAKKAFDANPNTYIPAYGGWCAFGMSVKDKFPVDPTNFKIVDGQLMVFLRNKNVDALAAWNKGNESKNVARAESHWKKVSG